MKILIIGIDSILGSALADKLIADDNEVIGTSRRPDSQHIPFDLSWDAVKWPRWPENIDVVYIMAAITKQSLCNDRPEFTHFINVEQTIRLITHFAEKNVAVIFPSTNLVLSCDESFQKENSILAPIGAYGRQKAEVESFLRNNVTCRIARLSKILHPHQELLMGWKKNLLEGKRIKAFDNLYISPITVGYAVDFLSRLSRAVDSGIWQISADKEVSYFNFAVEAAKFLQINPADDFVERESLVDAGVSNPRHPSLDSTKSLRELGLMQQTIPEVIRECFS